LFADDWCKPVLSFSVPSDLVGGTLSASLLCLFVYCLSLHNTWDGVDLNAVSILKKQFTPATFSRLLLEQFAQHSTAMMLDLGVIM